MAQLVARTPGGREVVGSSPATPTTKVVADTVLVSFHQPIISFLGCH